MDFGVESDATATVPPVCDREGCGRPRAAGTRTPARWCGDKCKSRVSKTKTRGEESRALEDLNQRFAREPTWETATGLLVEVCGKFRGGRRRRVTRAFESTRPEVNSHANRRRLKARHHC